MLSDTRIRDVFHFCFLERVLKLSDPSIYVLKGGVNLRFFFRSPRLPEAEFSQTAFRKREFERLLKQLPIPPRISARMQARWEALRS
jgi:hypothetical protein